MFQPDFGGVFAKRQVARNRRFGGRLLDKKCHLCHYCDMKTVSIKQLHETTGRYVREAASQAVYVTDHGQLVAVLKPVASEDLPGRPFPRRRARDLPSGGVDSTAGISAERDFR